MAWLDLEAEILGEFVSYTPDVGLTYDEFASSYTLVESDQDKLARNRAYKADMIRRGLCTHCGKDSDRRGKRTCTKCMRKLLARWHELYSTRRNCEPKPCAVCQKETTRASDTCSKKCTQIRRARVLIARGICVDCKLNPARKTAQTCAECSGHGERLRANPREPRPITTRRCAVDGCHNHLVVNPNVGAVGVYCSDSCFYIEKRQRKKARDMARVDIRKGDRVLVVSCKSEDLEVRKKKAERVGSRGRVIKVGELITVQFYGKNQVDFFPDELSKLS